MRPSFAGDQNELFDINCVEDFHLKLWIYNIFMVRRREELLFIEAGRKFFIFQG